MKSNIRNFCIIAHIDHGKSTLADRILELTGALSAREKRDQFLDSMDLERERGITIKAQSVRLAYTTQSGEQYQFNLIDTPGHVDFHYEVSRSLAACEGALLVIDAVQGIEAQTVANALAASASGLEILPVVNKIDLPGANLTRVQEELEDVLAIDGKSALAVSAKTGEGVRNLLEAVVKKLPPPRGEETAPPRALIFDSWFDSYQGVVVLIRVVDGVFTAGMNIRLVHAKKDFVIGKMGFFDPHPCEKDRLETGEVGFVVAGIRDVTDARIGETMTSVDRPCVAALKGFQEVKPMVFAGLYPIDSADYENLRDALTKLKLNDASFSFEPETSLALGFGFRCGFLGSLHVEIVQERLEREFDVALISTAPTVVYEVKTTSGDVIRIESPAKLPDTGSIDEIREPYVTATIHAPQEFIGPILQLCQARRGEQRHMEYFGRDRVMMTYSLPMSEMMVDFFDQLKSCSKGYASLDYELEGFTSADLVRLNVLVNGDPVDAFSTIVHRDEAYYRGRTLVGKLRTLIPRQQFDVALQAAIGGKIIARETVKALRKNVTAKCYGGDVTRKRKLLEKQKEGKKRMKQVGQVEIPQEAFRDVLRNK